MHIREPIVATLKLERQVRVVESRAVFHPIRLKHFDWVRGHPNIELLEPGFE